MIYGFFIGDDHLPVYANWVWGGGWLSQLGKNFGLGHGHVDFAGSSVVHMTGGVCALAGAMMIGPRIGKYNKDGSPNAIPGHHIPMAILGTFILAFGWFGFNAGSTLAGTDLRIGVVAVNTMLASAAGALLRDVYMWSATASPTLSMMRQRHARGPGRHHRAVRLRNAPAPSSSALIAGVLVVLSRLLRRADAEDRRSGRRHLGPRRQRRLGRPLARPLRRRHLRRRLERRRRHGEGPLLRRRRSVRRPVHRHR